MDACPLVFLQIKRSVLFPLVSALTRFRRFAGVNISKCLKIKARVKKVCTTAGLID